MPARSEWKGFLRINQLQVAVKAFSAVSAAPEITLNQLHRDCGERIRQKKICPIHGEIEPDAIIPGYQVAEDCYLPLDPFKLDQLRPVASKAIDVECFIDSREIDPTYHTGRTLYLVPDGPPGQRSFNLLREGMKESGRHAFSRIVMSRRELLVLLRPYGRLIALTVIEYPHRVRSTADYESEVASLVPGEQELSLIQQLIGAMTDRAFELSRYRDRHLDQLSALIEQKVAEADLISPAASRSMEVPETADDGALLAVLQASLNAAGVSAVTLPDRAQRVSPYPAENGQSLSKLA